MVGEREVLGGLAWVGQGEVVVWVRGEVRGGLLPF